MYNEKEMCIRDSFYDETGVPILYMDMCMQLFNKSVDLFMMDKIQTDPVGVMTVSYTHLDVYKRQELER